MWATVHLARDEPNIFLSDRQSPASSSVKTNVYIKHILCELVVNLMYSIKI